MCIITKSNENTAVKSNWAFGEILFQAANRTDLDWERDNFFLTENRDPIVCLKAVWSLRFKFYKGQTPNET